MPGLDSNTKLLLNMNGVDGATTFIDDTDLHTFTPNGGAQIDTAESKFGGASCLFDGSGDYVSSVNSDDWDFFGNTSDTKIIDFWFKRSTAPASNVNEFFTYQGDAPGNNFWAIRLGQGINFGKVYIIATGGFGQLASTTVFQDTNWHHVAIVKIANVYGLYVDGIQEDYKLSNNTLNRNEIFRIGTAAYNINLGFKGWIDMFRIQFSNDMNANPNSGLTDTITVPTSEYTQSIPNPPTNLQATADVVDINLTWDAPIYVGDSAIIGYKIERESPEGGGFSTIIEDTETTDTFYDDVSLSSDTQYNYRISAINSDGISNPSNTADATTDIVPEPPDAINDLLVETENKNKINLSWSAPFDGNSEITGYKIERESPKGDGFSTLIEDTENTATNYSDIGLSSNTQYNYRISAINSIGISEPSNEFSDTTIFDSDIDISTKLMLHFNDEPIKDVSTQEHIINSVLTPSLDTINKKFGTGSILLNGVGEYIYSDDSDDWDIFDGSNTKITIDFFIKFNTNTNLYIVHGSPGARWRILISKVDNTFNLVVGSLGISESITIPSGFNHFAIIKLSNIFGVYINGIQVVYNASIPSRNYTGQLRIGENTGAGSTSTDFNIDEFRIIHDNPFNANPNSGLTDTIIVPTSEHVEFLQSDDGIRIRKLDGKFINQKNIGGRIFLDLFTGKTYTKIRGD